MSDTIDPNESNTRKRSAEEEHEEAPAKREREDEDEKETWLSELSKLLFTHVAEPEWFKALALEYIKMRKAKKLSDPPNWLHMITTYFGASSDIRDAVGPIIEFIYKVAVDTEYGDIHGVIWPFLFMAVEDPDLVRRCYCVVPTPYCGEVAPSTPEDCELELDASKYEPDLIAYTLKLIDFEPKGSFVVVNKDTGNRTLEYAIRYGDATIMPMPEGEGVIFLPGRI